MSRGFGATLGIGTTDVLSTTNQNEPSGPISTVAWVFFRANTGTTQRIWDWSAGSVNDLLFVNAAGNVGFFAGWSTQGQFNTTSSISTGVWTAIGISYAAALTTDVPVIYFNGVPQPVSTAQAPAGARNLGGQGFFIGNSPLGTRNWDGNLAITALWNANLTAAEHAALAKGMLPNQIRPSSLFFNFPLDGQKSPEPDLSGNARNAALTGTKLQPGPPVAPFTRRSPPILLPVEGISGARRFNGVSDFGDYNNSGNGLISSGGNWSISCWVNMGAINNQPIFSQFINAAANGRILLRVSDSPTNVFELFLGNDSAGNGSTRLQTVTTVTTGAWVQLGASRNNKTFIIYLKGLQEATVTDPGGTPRVILNAGNLLGAFSNNLTTYNGTPLAFGNMRIADIAIWNATLSAQEFSGLGQGRRPDSIRQNALVVWNPLDGLQSPEPDLSGKRFNVTLSSPLPVSGPPISPFSPRWPQNLDVVAAPSFNPAWRVPFNQVVSGGVAT